MKKFDNFRKALGNLELVRTAVEPYDVLTLTGGVALHLLQKIKTDYIDLFEALETELEERWL